MLKKIRGGQRGHATDAPVLGGGTIADRGVLHEELYTMSDVALAWFEAALGKVAGQLFSGDGAMTYFCRHDVCVM